MDGSTSIYIPDLNESYHSKFGSIAESQHIYINNGLQSFAQAKKSIDVFEMGLGTGLNALLSFILSEENNFRINYTAIEKYPLTNAEVEALNYFDLLNRKDLATVFERIHHSEWNEEVKLSCNFNITKILMDIEKYDPVKKFDLVFYDAFAPEVQPNLWTAQIFRKIHGFMKPTAHLVTYCVKGVVRRTLKEVGFEVIKLKGPLGGKREILKAIKN